MILRIATIISLRVLGIVFLMIGTYYVVDFSTELFVNYEAFQGTRIGVAGHAMAFAPISVYLIGGLGLLFVSIKMGGDSDPDMLEVTEEWNLTSRSAMTLALSVVGIVFFFLGVVGIVNDLAIRAMNNSGNPMASEGPGILEYISRNVIGAVFGLSLFFFSGPVTSLWLRVDAKFSGSSK